ncbi:KUP/HAK/KT family potassium transporter [Nocardioides mangrovicus]|uniref:KUP/HAK/KT family potassium transporter n=1 Tax=Nocardioides mangrovicus TaxID=2478913 RepID=UPI0013142E08|nr:KUP/HAK/KT family potassium transporter [Nocardioides mangrovicus]
MTSRGRSGAALSLGALGVVFGDIGTSPLYAMKAVLGETPAIDRASVYGLTSTVIWTMAIVVCALYVGLLMSKDNEGEGGLLALLALLRRHATSKRLVVVMSFVGIAGAALFLGDSVVTPAISVLSAAEGLKIAAPSAGAFVVPIALVILAGVFVLQRVGSGRIGFLYGPVMLVWFAVLAAAGVVAVAQRPSVLQTLSPTWAVDYAREDPLAAFLALGSVVLTVTGAEALYADLGHFGRPAITRSWFGLVFPALVIAYLGEAAHVVGDHGAARDPFYGVVASWATIPVLVLATLATVIASQAVIAGTFTVLHQAGGLGLFPFLRARHPSEEEGGQIYLPAANWTLGAAVLAVVVGFRSSTALASAYGVAVSATILTTVVLFTVLAVVQRQRVRAVLAAALGLCVLVIAASTVRKIPSGGWLPVAVGLVLFVVMWTWWVGRARLRRSRARDEPALADLVADTGDAADLHRHAGTTVFLTDDGDRAPFALRFLLERESVVPEHAVIVSWRVDDTPAADPHETDAEVEPVACGSLELVKVSMTLGYRDRLDAQSVLQRAVERSPKTLAGVDPDQATYFVSEPLPRLASGGLPRWQQRLFCGLHRLATDRVEQLRLPRDRTLVVGKEYDL